MRMVDTAFVERHHQIFCLLVLALVECLVFGSSINRIGFYLDDWHLLKELQIASGSYPSLLLACLKDPRIIPRPLEAIHFATVYSLFHTSPLGYHIVNCLMEILFGWLSYLSLVRITNNHLFSFLVGV